MKPVRFILVGGFLGAGKTTLLAQASQRLTQRGHRLGLITNDQAAQLVDSENLRAQGLNVQEVAGGCFCCRFDDLLGSARKILSRGEVDIILGEPVGSCTDLSATVLQPLKQYCSVEFTVSPFTVMADVRRVRDLLNGEAKRLFPESVLYIYNKQLEEADLIVLNKTDMLPPEEVRQVRNALSRAFPNAAIETMCARSGDGVDLWLERMLSGAPAGQRIAPMDYDLYADGEAELGWLNALVELSSPVPVDWEAVARRLLGELGTGLPGAGGEIAHLKVFVTWDGGSAVGSITRSGEEPVFLRHGELKRSANAEMIVNARVRLAPEALRREIEAAVTRVGGQGTKIRSIDAFRPGRPKPTHRFACPV